MKQHILFVDDNESILALFRHVLPFLHQDWDAVFAMSGREGLAAMARGPIDVVVSDIDMPEMNGIAFLKEVEKRYPRTARFVFSGESGSEIGVNLLGTAHQFYQKPDDFKGIKSAVERVYRLFRVMPEEHLKTVIGQIHTLPTMPALYVQVTAELERAEPSVDRLGELIGKDIAMSAKLLQVVNSVFFGMRQHVASPRNAVALLGTDLVKNLVLMLHVFQEHKGARVEGLDLNALWRHSLAVADMARDIAVAEEMEKDAVDCTCSAGLFHDIGKLVLMINLPELYSEALKKVRARRADLSGVELEVLGASHGQVGAYLLGLWGFDDTFVNTCLFHHAPSAAGETTIGPLTAVHAANVFDHAIEPPDTGERPVRVDEAYLEEIGGRERFAAWEKSAVAEEKKA